MNSIAATAERLGFTWRKFKITLGVLIGTEFASIALVAVFMPIILVPLTKEFGWSRAEVSAGITIQLWTGAIMTMVWGGIGDRLGVRGPLAVGVAGMIAATLVLAQGHGFLPIYYACFVMFGVMGSTAINYTKIIGAIYTRRRGLAMAVVGMEGALISALLPFLLVIIQREFGWRGVVMSTAFAMICAAPLVFLLIEEPAHAARAKAGKVQAAAPAALPGLTAAQVRVSPIFWLVTGAGMAGNMAITGVVPHIVAIAQSAGLKPVLAVGALSVITIAQFVGQLCGGVTMDRSRTIMVAVPFLICLAAGLVTMGFASATLGGAPMLYVGAALTGFGIGGRRSMSFYFMTRYFGVRALGEIAGLNTAVSAFALAPAPLFLGWIFDVTGSYRIGVLVMAGSCVLAGILYLVCPPYRFTPEGHDLQAEGEAA